MNTVKVAITVPKSVLQIVDRYASQKKVSRSKFISRTLDVSMKILLEREVARSYDEVFEDEDVRSEQRDFTEMFIQNAKEIEKAWS